MQWRITTNGRQSLTQSKSKKSYDNATSALWFGPRDTLHLSAAHLPESGGGFPEAEQLIKNGELPSVLRGLENKRLEKILHHIRDMPQLPKIAWQLTPKDVAQGFRKWREATSTSPSGCHLGLCHMTTYRYKDKETENIKGDILQVQTQIINLPLRHGFLPRRWQEVVNAMIEKIPNHP
jgi:hypothetical protein